MSVAAVSVLILVGAAVAFLALRQAERGEGGGLSRATSVALTILLAATYIGYKVHRHAERENARNDPEPYVRVVDGEAGDVMSIEVQPVVMLDATDWPTRFVDPARTEVARFCSDETVVDALVTELDRRVRSRLMSDDAVRVMVIHSVRPADRPETSGIPSRWRAGDPPVVDETWGEETKRLLDLCEAGDASALHAYLQGDSEDNSPHRSVPETDPSRDR